MSGLTSQRKGKVAERKLVNKLKTFGFDAHRMYMSGAIETMKGDIELKVTDKWKFLIESKHYKKMSIFRIWNKIKSEVTGGRIPLMALKETNNDTLICMHLDDFTCLMEELKYPITIFSRDPKINPYVKYEPSKDLEEFINDLEKSIRKYRYKK